MARRAPDWTDTTRDPAERLTEFDSWIYGLLKNRLSWTLHPKKAARQIGQCKGLVLECVRELERHGYLFDGQPLRLIIEQKIDEIAALQKKGKVTELFPYFRAIFRGLVARNAEEYKDHALQLRCHINHYEKEIDQAVTIPALEAQRHQETLKERQARIRRQKAKKQSDQDQQTLF